MITHRFIIKGETDPAPTSVVSLEDGGDGVEVRLRVGQSVNMRIVEFKNNGNVILHLARLRSFGLVPFTIDGSKL